jgi:hypothetical protein
VPPATAAAAASAAAGGATEALLAAHALEVSELRAALAARAADASRGADAAAAELEELREAAADSERGAAATAAILARQAAALAALEARVAEESTARRRLHNTIEEMKGKVRVLARIRPLSEKERSEGASFALRVPDEFSIEHDWGRTLTGERTSRSYAFDSVLPPDASQEAVFESVRHLVQSALDGYNVCIFAYGQTGSGKTHTIAGSGAAPGVTPRACALLFALAERAAGKATLRVRALMLELYQDTLIDLLAPPAPQGLAAGAAGAAGVAGAAAAPGGGGGGESKLEIKKDSKGWVTVTNSTVRDAGSLAELQSVLAEGSARRKTAETAMNAESSRSHMIFSIILESTDTATQALTRGKLSFVDLAGSERLKKSCAEGQQAREAMAINLSLSALGNVIAALSSDAPFVPYRDHKLTMLMSDSLGGTAKTLMFVTVSPSDGNLDESAQSLAYAARVRSIKNDPSKSVATKEMQRLQRQVAHWRAAAGQPPDELADVEDGGAGGPAEAADA